MQDPHGRGMSFPSRSIRPFPADAHGPQVVATTQGEPDVTGSP